MPSGTPGAAHRVCIVIVTYKRNDGLMRLVNQAREMMGKYRGHNHYELCVTDSDRHNPLAPSISKLCTRYSINPGSGFDDNIYHFWVNNVDRYDYIFSISDDDLFAPWLNPLYLLDAAIETGHQVALFNHRYYQLQADGGIELGGVNFPEIELLYDKKLLLQRVLQIMPSHIGILYSAKLLKVTLKKAADFRDTLHLYTIPVILAAAANTLLYSEHVLCLYENSYKTDGAWGAAVCTMDALLDYLTKLKRLLPAELYHMAEEGFLYQYFREGSWLREKMRHDPRLKSEGEIRELLACA